jgi:hypothetical protein
LERLLCSFLDPSRSRENRKQHIPLRRRSEAYLE